MFEGETVSYLDDSGVFLISKTVGEQKKMRQLWRYMVRIVRFR